MQYSLRLLLWCSSRTEKLLHCVITDNTTWETLAQPMRDVVNLGCKILTVGSAVPACPALCQQTAQSERNLKTKIAHPIFTHYSALPASSLSQHVWTGFWFLCISCCPDTHRVKFAYYCIYMIRSQLRLVWSVMIECFKLQMSIPPCSHIHW